MWNIGREARQQHRKRIRHSKRIKKKAGKVSGVEVENEETEEKMEIEDR